MNPTQHTHPPPTETFSGELPAESVPAWLHPVSRKYLHERGLSEQETADYDLQYCEGGLWKHRIIIPIYNVEDRLIAYQGRIIDPAYTGKDKYRTAGCRPLYKPWDRDPDIDVQTAIIAEGPFDVIALARVLPTVATLGFMPSIRQLGELIILATKWHIQTYIIWYDQEATQEAYNLQLKLRPYVDTHVIIQPDGYKDPGDMPPEAIDHTLTQEGF